MIGDSPLVSYFRQAKHFHGPGGNLPITRIVIHDAEYPETPQGAEWVVDYFAGAGAPQASAHYAVDSNSVAQSVREIDTAWHAPPNRYSIGIEHAGYMAQSRKDWLDDYSQAELKMSAKLVAELCKRHEIPIVKLSAHDLVDGKHGICGHVDVSNAFHKTDHGDPGPNFPWDTYLKWINEEYEGRLFMSLTADEEQEILAAARVTNSQLARTKGSLTLYQAVTDKHADGKSYKTFDAIKATLEKIAKKVGA